MAKLRNPVTGTFKDWPYNFNNCYVMLCTCIVSIMRNKIAIMSPIIKHY